MKYVWDICDVRSICGYAGEVGAEKWKEVEILQRHAVRLILVVSQAKANEVL